MSIIQYMICALLGVLVNRVDCVVTNALSVATSEIEAEVYYYTPCFQSVQCGLRVLLLCLCDCTCLINERILSLSFLQRWIMTFSAIQCKVYIYTRGKHCITVTLWTVRLLLLLLCFTFTLLSLVQCIDVFTGYNIYCTCLNSLPSLDRLHVLDRLYNVCLHCVPRLDAFINLYNVMCSMTGCLRFVHLDTLHSL